MTPSASKPKSTRVKVREHRERLRSQGLRPVPDLGAGGTRVLPGRRTAGRGLFGAPGRGGEDGGCRRLKGPNRVVS